MEILSLDPVIQFGLRGAIAVILLAAAVHKLRHWAEFKTAVTGYEILPEGLVPVAAFGLTAIEVVLVISLLALPLAIAPAFGAAGLFVAYAIAMAIALGRGHRNLDCGCGGLSSSQDISLSLIIRNGGLALLTLFAATPATLSGFIRMDWGTVLFVILFGAVSYAAVDTLLNNANQIASREAGR